MKMDSDGDSYSSNSYAVDLPVDMPVAKRRRVQQSPIGMDEMPDEVLEHIFDQIPVELMDEPRRVSRRFRNVATESMSRRLRRSTLPDILKLLEQGRAPDPDMLENYMASLSPQDQESVEMILNGLRQDDDINIGLLLSARSLPLEAASQDIIWIILHALGPLLPRVGFDVWGNSVAITLAELYSRVDDKRAFVQTLWRLMADAPIENAVETFQVMLDFRPNDWVTGIVDQKPNDFLAPVFEFRTQEGGPTMFELLVGRYMNNRDMNVNFDTAYWLQHRDQVDTGHLQMLSTLVVRARGFQAPIAANDYNSYLRRLPRLLVTPTGLREYTPE